MEYQIPLEIAGNIIYPFMDHGFQTTMTITKYCLQLTVKLDDSTKTRIVNE